MNVNRLHFQVERDEGDVDIDAMIAGVKVGHVKTVRDGDRLLLADLNVADSIPRQWPVFPSLLRAVLGERQPWSARGKGIGRELLRRVLEEADATGVCEIWGSITSRDSKKDAVSREVVRKTWFSGHGTSNAWCRCCRDFWLHQQNKCSRHDVFHWAAIFQEGCPREPIRLSRMLLIMAAKRIQLRRSKGWRMPPNTIKVDRSTRWGNPFKVGTITTHPKTRRAILVTGKEHAIALFALHLEMGDGLKLAAAARQELRDKNLACWCKDGDGCHADVLLRVANGDRRRAA